MTIGTSPQGQGHETTAAQVTADILGCSPDQVHVVAGYNKAANTYVGFSGTYASQFAVTGLGAVMGAAERLRGEIVKVGACMLGAEESDIELADGFVRLAANHEAAIPFIGIAATVFANVAELPGELADSVTLNCRYVYRPPFTVPDHETKRGKLTLTYASQVHAAVVELDEETGQVTILDYAAVDECGRKVNPKIVEGQVHGATGHGIGAALYETFEYDADGQLLQLDLRGLPRGDLARRATHPHRGDRMPLAVHAERREGHGRGRRRAAVDDLQRDRERPARGRAHRLRHAQQFRAGL